MRFVATIACMLLAFLTVGEATAQDGTITGTVIDEETSEPLRGPRLPPLALVREPPPLLMASTPLT